MEGIIPLWKERGMTSHDCVFRLRKILHMKKIGHSGTLDPDVDGVLPICVGTATKVVEFLQDSGKTYEGEITLGFDTTTEDASGEVVTTTPITRPFSHQEIDLAMAAMVGEITQIPPMYSAVKVNGRRLYEYARRNEPVVRPQRKAQIDRFQRISEPVWDERRQTQSWRFQVVCGKGTYVRTLSVDTGKKLGVAAHMSDLTRTASGGFSKEQAVTLTQVANAVETEDLSKVLWPLEYGVTDFPRQDINEEVWQKVKNGMRLSHEFLGLNDLPNGPVALFYHNQVVSLYEPNPKEQGKLKPMKVFRTEVK